MAEEREELVENAVGKPLTLALFFVMLAALEWWRYYKDIPPSPVLFTGAASMAIAYAVLRIFRAVPKLRALRLAMNGERAVGQFLERLREQGFHVFHDIVGVGFNVDHVIVGPAGVFTIETKTWSKPSRGDARIIFDGKTIRAGIFEPDRDPVIQAKAQATWMRALLLESTGRKIQVRPVVVFPGCFVENAPGTFRDIWVLEPKALPTFLRNEPACLADEDVRLASFHLSRMIRTTVKNR